MPGALHAFLTADHERLDELLVKSPGDAESYNAFRKGLLRHIAIEEQVLFPLLRDHALVAQLHRDHAALAALLVPPPTRVELDQIAAILGIHNVLEEQLDGLYEIVEQLAGDDLDALMARVHAIPPVRVVPNVDTPIVRQSIERLLREASGSGPHR